MEFVVQFQVSLLQLDASGSEGEVADWTFELLMKDHVGEAESGFV